MTTVSAIVPCYGGAEWIEECVRSVLDQTYDDLEVVVIDDASPDDAADVVAGIDDDRVRLLRHDENQGIAAARNTGIEAADGDYVGFLDQDDRWHEEKLARQVAAFEEGPDDLGVVYGDLAFEGRDADSWAAPLPDEPRARVRSLFVANHVPSITALVDADCFRTHGLLDESLYGADDYEFWLRIAEDYRFRYLPGGVATRRVHETNSSDRFERMNADKEAIAERYLEAYPYLEPLRDRKYHQIATHYARNYAADGDYRRALCYDLQALRRRQTSAGDYVRLARDVAGTALQIGGSLLDVR